jgi:hypothetical protein
MAGNAQRACCLARHTMAAMCVGDGWWEGEKCVKVRREDVKWEDGEWQRQAAGERRMLYRAKICE